MKGVLGLGVAALLLAAGLVGADDKAQAGPKDKFDAAKLVGTWTYVSGEKGGEKVDTERFQGQTVVITKDTLSLKGGPAGNFVMKYELDAQKTPAAIKLTMTESPFGAGAAAAGVIELKGDDLKLCYAPMGGAAPTKFETKDGGHHLFVLKRSKE
jgi:uncharacterized protein (TIGR03067 family)